MAFRFRTPALLLCCLAAVPSAMRPARAAGAPLAPAPRAVWVNLGGGLGTAGLAGGTTACYRRGDRVWSLRSVGNYGIPFPFGTDDEKVWDVAVLRGHISRGRWGSACNSLGVGIVGLEETRWGSPVYLPRHTVGVAWEGQYYVTPIRDWELGLGLTAFGNLNSKRSFAGALFCLRLGGPPF